MRGLAALKTPGIYPNVKAVQRPAQWGLLPGTHQVKAVNITAQQVPNDGSYFRSWQDFFYVFPWTTWIKPQIDLAVTLGCNTVRFFGSTYCRYGPSDWGGVGGAAPSNQTFMTLAAYLARWDTMLDYCRSLGLYVYPCLSGDSSASGQGFYGYTPTLAWFQAEFAAVTRSLSKYSDLIIGIDILNEVDGPAGWANTGGKGFALYNAIKNAVPWIPLTFDVKGAAYTTASNFVTNAYDFLDFHTYSNQAAGDIDAGLTAFGVPIILGEFGEDVAAGTPARQTRYNSVANMMNFRASGRYAAGACAWSLADQNGTIDTKYGIADSSLNTRADVTSIFQGLPS